MMYIKARWRKFTEYMRAEFLGHTMGVKCNISKTGDKIYHLPNDRFYKVTKIDHFKGECLCQNIQEAEKKGFRRSTVI